MLKIYKISAGFRFSQSAFRVGTLHGMLTDEILSLVSQKPFLDHKYFDSILLQKERNGLMLRNENKGHQLNITTDDFIFTHDRYDPDQHLSLEKFFSHFEAIWRKVDKTLSIPAIRRIGIVAEHRIENTKFPSSKLISSITKMKPTQFAGKFICNFEKRIPVANSVNLDVSNDEFLNLIYSFYDSEMDSQTPASNAVNANLDVQKYYGPTIESGFITELGKVRTIFMDHWKDFEQEIKDWGLNP